jgi:hypothetical protein
VEVLTALELDCAAGLLSDGGPAAGAIADR